MALRLRHILLRVETDGGLFGASIPFGDGLVILWADNTKGKSTVVQSIIYALGLEGMLSASQDVPLPHVMTDSVEEGDRTHRVLNSSVSVEIENGSQQRATVTRSVKGGRSRHLVNVVYGAALTSPNQRYENRDYFVREPGAATRLAGFHHWLADWIGWKLPSVSKYDGAECPLYLECMFPLMVVEQKRGWGGIAARMPLHYRIRDVGKRAVEFLLSLDVYETTNRRQRLKEESDSIKVEWRKLIASADSLIAPANGVIQNLPRDPVPGWPPQPEVQPIVSRRRLWLLLKDALKEDRASLAALENVVIPRVKQISVETSRSLQAAEVELAEVEFARRRLFEEFQIESNQIAGLSTRIATLEEDVQRNKDVRKLRHLGSEQQIELADGACPTCHRPLPDSLLPLDSRQEPMTLDDNIAYLESQLETLRSVLKSSNAAIVGKERRLAAMRAHADEVRGRIRALKETLVSNGQEPSIAAVEARIRVRESIRLLTHVDDGIGEILDEFERLSAKWREVQRQLASLPKDDLSAGDIDKLAVLQRLFVDQAKQYGVTSLPPSSLTISRENYKPVHDGFELEFDVSASDMVRVIWAYLHGLLEVSRERVTNHLGLLLLDEPRQQEAKRISLDQFMQRASTSIRYGQQVIIATSEEEQNLRSRLSEISHTYIGFVGHIIKRVS